MTDQDRPKPKLTRRPSLPRSVVAPAVCGVGFIVLGVAKGILVVRMETPPSGDERIRHFIQIALVPVFVLQGAYALAKAHAGWQELRKGSPSTVDGEFEDDRTLSASG